MFPSGVVNAYRTPLYHAPKNVGRRFQPPWSIDEANAIADVQKNLVTLSLRNFVTLETALGSDNGNSNS
jgi:hypothetical protein